MKLLKELWYKAVLFSAKTYIRIKWSTWNPWSIGRLNLAWGKYLVTPMYAARAELDHQLQINQANYEGDYPYEAFMNNHEFDFFYKKRTLSDRARLFFAPFSFGNRFRMPIWRIKWWWYGIDENNVI